MARYSVVLAFSLLCLCAMTFAQELHVADIDDFDLAVTDTMPGSMSSSMTENPMDQSTDVVPPPMMSSFESSHAKPSSAHPKLSSAHPTPIMSVHPSMSMSVSSMHPTSGGNHTATTPSSHKTGGFDGGSFVGGIALGIGLCIIMFGVHYYYKRRQNDYGRL